MIPLLLQPDSAFGWTGISTGFPSSWRWTAGEVAEVIEKTHRAQQVFEVDYQAQSQEKSPKMTTFKQALAADFAAVFANTSEFGELAVYTSPAGVQTANVPVVAAVQGFINEMANTAGLGGTIVIARSVVNAPAIHGKITITSGTFIITQIISIDDDTVTVSAMADTRISPAGMRQ